MTFDEIIQSRYSVRKLLPKPTEPKLLEEALAVHPFAPTAKNNQPKRSMSSKERPPLKLSIPWPIAVTGPGPSSSSFTMNPRFGGTPSILISILGSRIRPSRRPM